MNEIELLNSEGPILVLKRENENEFVIYDKEDTICEILTKQGITDFIHGRIEVQDSFGTNWIYTRVPGSMKPNLKELDEFIGIDTTGKIY